VEEICHKMGVSEPTISCWEQQLVADLIPDEAMLPNIRPSDDALLPTFRSTTHSGSTSEERLWACTLTTSYR
jgi:transcriptional regulator with XRE-family HTH domain